MSTHYSGCQRAYLERLPLETQPSKSNARLGITLHIIQEVLYHRNWDDVADVLRIGKGFESNANNLWLTAARCEPYAPR